MWKVEGNLGQWRTSEDSGEHVRTIWEDRWGQGTTNVVLSRSVITGLWGQDVCADDIHNMSSRSITDLSRKQEEFLMRHFMFCSNAILELYHLPMNTSLTHICSYTHTHTSPSYKHIHTHTYFSLIQAYTYTHSHTVEQVCKHIHSRIMTEWEDGDRWLIIV